MGEWVDCNGTVGTIEGIAPNGTDDDAPASANAAPVYVVQVWQPTLSQINCPADQLRVVAAPDAPQTPEAAPRADEVTPALEAPPAPEQVPAPQSALPLPAPPAPAPEASAGKVRDGKYGCSKIVGGGGEYRKMGTFNIRNGKVTGSPFPDGWEVLEVRPFNPPTNPDIVMQILYRTASGNTDLMECVRE